MMMTYSEFGKKLKEFCNSRECDACRFFKDDTSGCTFRDVCDNHAPYELVDELVGEKIREHAETCELKAAEPSMSINAKNVYISFNQIERNTEHE